MRGKWLEKRRKNGSKNGWKNIQNSDWKYGQKEWVKK